MSGERSAASEHLHPVPGVSDRHTFEGVVRLTWYGDECNIDIGDDCIDAFLIEREGKRVRVEIEVHHEG